MKSQKGITMVSLSIYIVLIFIAIAILATITASVQNSVKNENNDGEKMAEFNKFNMYFIKEIKNEQSEVTQVTNSTVSFSNGKTFSFDSQNNCIKLLEGTSAIKIAENIESCTFTKTLENGKEVINVVIKPQDLATITKEYVLHEKINNSFEDEENYTYIIENVATE